MHPRTFCWFYSVSVVSLGSKRWREEEEGEMNDPGGRGGTRIFPYLCSTLLHPLTRHPPKDLDPAAHLYLPTRHFFHGPKPEPGRLLSSFDQNPKNYKNDFSEVQNGDTINLSQLPLICLDLGLGWGGQGGEGEMKSAWWDDISPKTSLGARSLCLNWRPRC